MARLILGAMITDIRGSIGGTTIRKVGSTFVMSNKSSGINKQNLFRNDTLAFKSYLFQLWRQFSDSERKAWETASIDFPQLDRFGNSVILAPYNFYTKFMLQQAIIKYQPYNPLDFSNIIVSGTIENFVVNHTLGEVSCQMVDNLESAGVVIQIYRIPNESVKPIFNRRKFLYGGNHGDGDVIDLKQPFIDRFGAIPPSGFYRLVFYLQNFYGFRSVPQFIDTEVI